MRVGGQQRRCWRGAGGTGASSPGTLPDNIINRDWLETYKRLVRDLLETFERLVRDLLEICKRLVRDWLETG